MNANMNRQAHVGAHAAPRRRGAIALALCGLLAACETSPRTGGQTLAQVIEVVQDRHNLRDGYPELHAALRAGVTQKDLDDARLVLGECAISEASQPQRLRWITMTALLPPGTRLAPGSRMIVRDARPAWPATDASPAQRLHGQFVRADAAPASRETPLCHGNGGSTQEWQVRVRGTPPAWNHTFAQASLQRLDRFSDEDFRAGRVLRLGCQLKVIDGGDWYVPVWVARAPDGLSLAVGDVVGLRAGAQADSKDAAPLAEVLERRRDIAAPGGNAVVRCH